MNWRDLVRENENLSKKTFYGIAGQAQYYAEVTSQEEISFLLDEAKKRNLTWRVMGSGTNLVIQSGLLEGLTLKLKRNSFKEITLKDNIYEVGAAGFYPALVKRAIEEGYEAAATLGGIPGTVGGALVMNAGGHHGEIGDFILDVTGFDENGQLKVWQNKDCAFAYRHSNLKNSLLLSCRLDFGKTSEGAKEKFSDWVKWKSDSQPSGFRSAGCIFKNPEGASAGRLIDLSGFKGYRRGDIEVSEKHANFLLNHGAGRFEDLKSIVTEIKAKVLEDHGVVLEEEVEIWENA
jgi:UDP-N-acetylmuramate dehydrogenase